MMRKKEIYKKLHHWYQEHGRHDLPWRHTEDAYCIYVSEIMLQQTQVKTVLERYYFQFLERFPSLEVLAEAPLDDVLKMWEGLGYYTRARNLHACAKITAPTLPESYDALLKLPGIGKNTASALCAFAYKQPLAVMEANVKRILSRIHAHENPSDAQLRQDALSLLDVKNPYDYNQAMMDIGSMLCTVKNPDCLACPFSTICKAYEESYFHYPAKKKKSVPLRQEVWLVKSHGKSVQMKQRKGKFLHGLWGFEKAHEGYHDKIYLGNVRQSYTHFKLQVEVYHDKIEGKEEGFFKVKEIETLALSGIDKKVIELLKIKKIL
jgi:A/G-specific adenine glycosylase